jgi:hypothetical protein
MTKVNYLAPLPQMPVSNKYNKPPAPSNGNFSKILDSKQKNASHITYVKKTAQDFINETKNASINSVDKNGTNIAIKDLAIDMEQQFLAYMWNLAFSSAASDANSSSGERIFQQELVDEIVKTANDGEMGEIAQDIYEEVLRLEGIKDDSRISHSGTVK